MILGGCAGYESVGQRAGRLMRRRVWFGACGACDDVDMDSLREVFDLYTRPLSSQISNSNNVE